MTTDLFSSAEGSSGRVITARILPNLDVLETVEKVCNEYNIKYGQITTSIGSLKEVTLTYVDRIDPTPEGGYTTKLNMKGPFSLIVGQGLISPADETGKRNIHYHAVISGKDNKFYGGDIKPGTITLTTLDLVITEIKGIKMTRNKDTQTGAIVTTVIQA